MAEHNDKPVTWIREQCPAEDESIDHFHTKDASTVTDFHCLYGFCENCFQNSFQDCSSPCPRQTASCKPWTAPTSINASVRPCLDPL